LWLSLVPCVADAATIATYHAATRSTPTADARPASNHASARPTLRGEDAVQGIGGTAPSVPRRQPPAGGQATGERPAAAQSEGEAGSAAAPSEGDFLAENGLGSPICREAVAIGAGARANCASAGFTAAPAPTGNYAFDVHIDTGLGHLSNYLEADVQDAAQWAWMALVALVRGLIVMLEWCYSLNLLSGVILTQVARGLRAAEGTFTAPLLAVVLAAASILAVHHGLIRRRPAQTLGQVLVMLAMMAAGMWVIVDPAASVGAPAGWVDQASVAALGAVAGGTPDHPERTLAQEMQDLFANVITGPWCFMEVGDVRWCRDPQSLDARLHKAALGIAASSRSLASSQDTSGSRHKALLNSAALLERATSNGEIFLALPANGPARNSINESGSLLSVLCGGSHEATDCAGPTAPEAEFRTEHGTAQRIVGLLLIWLGALGMLVLFGWIGLRLLGAAILSLFFLLLAPAAVLAPALGESGRAVFRTWSTRLLGALTAKLIYSVLLGVVLMMMDLLTAVGALGWWVQWFLISAVWWIVFHQRRELLSLARVGDAAPWARRGAPAPGARAAPGTSGLLGRVKERALHRATDATLIGAARRAMRTISPPPASSQGRARLRQHARARARGLADKQVAQTLERDHAEASARVAEAGAIQDRISAKRTQLARVRASQHAAENRRAARQNPASEAARSDARAGAKLGARAERMEAEIAHQQGALTAARQTVAEGRRAQQQEGRNFSETQLLERTRFYDEQAALPDKGRRQTNGARRDYRRLAGLAGYGVRDWDELDAEKRHRAMLKIDDQLAMRSGLERAEQRAVEAREAAAPRRERRKLDREFERAHQHELRGRGHHMPVSPQSPSKLAAWLEHEREEAAKGGAPLPLAEKARRERGAPAEGDLSNAAERLKTRERLQRRRRQFGRPGRESPEE
jgi:hypothetical protein